jgi:hypothetical protein
LRPFSRNVLIPNFQVYTGKLGDAAVALDVGEPRETQDPAEVGSHTS